MKYKSLTVFFLLAAVSLPFTACKSDGNKYESTTNYNLYTLMADSISVFANVSDSLERDSAVYRNDITFNTVFKLSHYCYAGKFAGGFTATNMSDVTTADPTNYASIVGHSVLYNQNTGSYSKSYFVGDLSHPCRISFSGNQLTPQDIFVSNATYSYLCMKQGTASYPAFTNADYLKLRIEGFSSSGSASGKYVEVDLAKGTDIASEWIQVDLTPIGSTYGLAFDLISTQGYYNQNIALPPLFCFDFLTTTFSYSITY